MTNYLGKIYNYTYLRDFAASGGSDRYPNAMHDMIQDDSYGLYYKTFAEVNKIYKTTDEGQTVELVETRGLTQDALANWHDRDNHILYFLEIDVNTDIASAFSIDLTDDSVTELGEMDNTKDHQRTGDILKIGSDIYVILLRIDFTASPDDHYVEVYKYTDPGWNLEASQLIESWNGNTGNLSFGVVVSGDIYFVVDDKTNSEAELWFYDVSLSTFTKKQEISGSNIPSTRNYTAISYDNNNSLYFIVYTTSKYLYQYQISTDSIEEISEYNIQLMLNRNTDTTRNPPYNLEKAIELYPDANLLAKAFKISKSRGYLFAISEFELNNAADYLLTVTDDYLVIDATASGGTGQLWKYVDFSSYVLGRSVIRAVQRNYWSCDMYVRTTGALGDYNIFDGMFIQIIGNLSAQCNTGTLSYFGSPDNFNDEDITEEWYFGIPDDINLETVGDTNTNITFLDYCATGSNTYAIIIESVDNHNNVMKFVDNNASGERIDAYHYFAGAVADRTEEYWFAIEDITASASIEVYFYESTTELFRIYSSTNDLYYQDSGGSHVLKADCLVNNTFVHIKVVLDDTANTVDIYVDEALEVNNAPYKTNSITGLDRVRFRSPYNNAYNANCFIDGWGDSVQTEYTVGDNYIARSKYGSMLSWVDYAHYAFDYCDSLNNWTVSDGVGCTSSIEATINGETLVYQIFDNGAGQTTANHYFDAGDQTSGSIFCKMSTDDVTKELFLEMFNDAGTVFAFKIEFSGFYYYDNTGWHDTGHAGPANNTWYKIEMAFECGTGTYYGLAQYKWYVYIDDVQYGPYDFVANRASVNRVKYGTETTDQGYNTWLTDLHFSWDTHTPKECLIESSWQSHKQCLKLTQNADTYQPYVKHNITQTTASTHEFYVGGTDTAEEFLIQFKENGIIIINLKIDADKLYYESSAPAWTEIQAVADNTLYHLKVIWRADNTFDVYVDETIQVNNQATRNNQSSGINIIQIQIIDNNGCSYYLDAYGEIANSNYYVGRNLIKTKENAILYEGYARYSDLKDPRKIWIDSPALRDLKNKIFPGSYSGDTDAILSDIFDDSFNYITAGTMSSGTAMGTVYFRGSKKGKRIIDNYAQIDSFTWVIKPDDGRGLLNYNDGSVNSYITITEADKLGWDGGKKIRDVVNQVNLKGAINPATGKPFESTYNNKASQKIYGVQPVFRTFAQIDDQTILDNLAQSIGTVAANVPFQYKFRRKARFEGLILPIETLNFAYSPESISSSDRIIHSCEYYFRTGQIIYQIIDAL